MTQSATIGILLIGSYLLGSLPFGLWLARWWKGVDIRTLGSGNIGSTNVGRICGPVAGAVVFAFDVGKGLLPPLVGITLNLESQWLILAAMLAIIGHNYSVWLGFKGGKGIATSLGALLGVSPLVGLGAFALFGIEILTLRWVSVGSIIAALSLPVLMPIFYPGDYYRLAFGTLACIMAVYKHRSNIQRLRNGTEPKINLPWTKKTAPPTEPTGKVTEDDNTHDSAHPTQNSELRTQNSERRTPTPYSDSLWEEFAEVDIADVVVDVDAPDLQPSYSYRVPEEIQNTLNIGDCVHISFSGRETLGYVLTRRKLSLSDPLCAKLKPILAIITDAISINPEQLRTVQWMSERYVCDLLSAIRCVAPTILSNKLQTGVRLKDPNVRGSDAGESVARAHLVETLRSLGGSAELEELREAANLPHFSGAYAELVRAGMLVETKVVARPKAIGKKIKVYSLGAAADSLASPGRRSPQQQRLLNYLVERARRGDGTMTAEELLTEAQASAASLRGLVEKGLVVVQEKTLRRAPIVAPETRTVAPTLTPGQQNAADTLRKCLASGKAETVLLFGVTASGKTEVYLDAITATLEQGRSAIVLVPEIALTAQVVDIFVGRFGEQVAVLHSKLSEGERHDEWRRMQEGKARIVVGARSAIFAPVVNVGLIVVDEEHEASYKQDNTPRYNAKDLAAERARLSGATLVLGSATPSLESYFASEALTPQPPSPDTRLGSLGKGESTHSTLSPLSLEGRGVGGEGSPPASHNPEPSPFPTNEVSASGKGGGGLGILRIEMRQRIDNRPLPRVEVVDLREEFKQRRALFSQRLIEAIGERLRRKQQIILFLNRRGYAQFVLCRDCGWVAKCPNCAVSLAFHVYDRQLKCHHCEYAGRAPAVCPDCGSAKVKAFGIGTEKVEEEVLKIFPSARVARLDRDTTAKKGAHTRLIRDFREGESEILIGTQMVAKGLDFPNVTLVGVISADTAINMPDFRAAERTFQLLTQVAGRAGRGQHPGEVVIQTFSPDHYAIQAAVHQDYAAFYEQEILFRKELKYPPFSRFVNLICADVHERKAETKAHALAAALERVLPEDVEIIGPAPAPLARLKNQFRFHVALRAPTDAPLSEWVRAALDRLTHEERLGLSIDMDPLSMA